VDVFTAALNAIFDDPNMTFEASYTVPANGGPLFAEKAGHLDRSTHLRLRLSCGGAPRAIHE
jgi:hypothetical protein